MNYLIFGFGVFIGFCAGTIIAALMVLAGNASAEIEGIEEK